MLSLKPLPLTLADRVAVTLRWFTGWAHDAARRLDDWVAPRAEAARCAAAQRDANRAARRATGEHFAELAQLRHFDQHARLAELGIHPADPPQVEEEDLELTPELQALLDRELTDADLDRLLAAVYYGDEDRDGGRS